MPSASEVSHENENSGGDLAPGPTLAGGAGEPQAEAAGDRLVRQIGALALDFGVEDTHQRSAEPRDPKTRKLDMKKADALMSKALQIASANAVGKLENFCSADPANPLHNENFRKLFKSAGALRSALGNTPDPKVAANLQKLDAQLTEASKTKKDKFYERLDFLLGIAFGVLIAIQVALFVIGTGGIGSVAVLGIIRLSLIAFNSIILVPIWVATTAHSLNVNLFVTPAELNYESSILNSQIDPSEYSPLASRTDLDSKQSELTKSTIMSLVNVPMLALEGVNIVRLIRTEAGFSAAASYGRLTQEPVRGLSMPPGRVKAVTTFSDLRSQKGLIGAIQAKANEVLTDWSRALPKYQFVVAGQLTFEDTSLLRTALEREMPSKVETLIPELEKYNKSLYKKLKKVSELNPNYDPASPPAVVGQSTPVLTAKEKFLVEQINRNIQMMDKIRELSALDSGQGEALVNSLTDENLVLFCVGIKSFRPIVKDYYNVVKMIKPLHAEIKPIADPVDPNDPDWFTPCEEVPAN